MQTVTITDRQLEIYEHIADVIHKRGYPPTFRELMKTFGINSPNGVMCHMRALEKKGLIRREPGQSRAITLVEQDDVVTVRRADLETVREMVAMRIAGPETVELINRMLGE